ncbi:hypothetical protein ACQP2C_26170 [Micromonospora zamorensis]|uniref:hypothetical protein n=1 Tax=Micromonospora zamorensis TaxID=709883 RepID=UPI003D98D84E
MTDLLGRLAALGQVTPTTGIVELWESVHVAEPGSGGTFRPHPSVGHVKIGCVWELAVTRHETQAWTRFLQSARDGRAKLAYLVDRLTGAV